jgi:hypothetical protein
MHSRNREEKPGRLLQLLIPERPVFDPDSEQSLKEGLLPERGTLLDRILREPMALLTQRAHKVTKRKAS